MYHPKIHGLFYQGNTMVNCSTVFLGWYNCTMVQLITMVQVYHPKNHGTFYHGNTVVDITMVICTIVFGVVQLYHGIPWYN
jgi:hypothetical protein